MRTSAASDSAPIFCMMCARWNLMVRSAVGGRELVRDLLVQESGDDERHDLALAGRELLVALAQRARIAPLRVRDAVALDRRTDRVDQGLLANGLGQELDGARLHRADGHRDVCVCR